MSWCEYLFDIFQPYDVYQNSEEITKFPTHEMTLTNIAESQVVIVIVSPMFVDHCSEKLEQYTGVVVALLCGVEEHDLDMIAKVIPSSRDWRLVKALSGQRNITQTTLKLLDGDHSDEEGTPESDYLTMHESTLLNPQASVQLTPFEEPEETYLTMSGGLPPKDHHDDGEDTYLTMSGGMPPKDHHDDGEDTYLTMSGGALPMEEAGGDYQTMGNIPEVSEDLYEAMQSTRAPSGGVGDEDGVLEDTYEVLDSRPRRPPKFGAHEFTPGIGYVNAPQGESPGI